MFSLFNHELAGVDYCHSYLSSVEYNNHHIK